MPEPQRSWRLLELESDLHEHLAHALTAGEKMADTSFEVLLRVLLGIPADLSWRRGVTRGVRSGSLLLGRMMSVVKRALLGLGVAASMLLGAWFVMNGIGIAVGGGEGGESMLIWGVFEVVAGAMLVVGPPLASRRPRLGAILVVLGTLVIGVTHVWLVALNVPVGAALIAAAVLRSRAIATRRAGATA